MSALPDIAIAGHRTFPEPRRDGDRPDPDEGNDSEIEVISRSWRRCAELHHIDPEALAPPRILTASDLRLSKEPIEHVVCGVRAELDQLHQVVGKAGYVTLFCDTQGVAVEHRGSEERSAEFRYWGIWLGGVWSEASRERTASAPVSPTAVPSQCTRRNTFARVTPV